MAYLQQLTFSFLRADAWSLQLQPNTCSWKDDPPLSDVMQLIVILDMLVA